ncbi:MAG: LysR family transcriptional regulator [Gammaproteobacteria bacterium]|nr:LysR family transcriptional regulator [Gammaproteobacteria bacterium]
MYNLDHLRMFVTVVETGSFSACARKLSKAQSAVSQGIANLEVDLATLLFDRSTRKPTLTVKGQQLLSHAQAVLKQAHEMETVALALDNNEEAGLVIALDDALLIPQLQQLLSDFSLRFCATTLTIKTTTSQNVATLIQAQQADIGLMFSDLSFPQALDLCYLGGVDFVAVVSRNHPLAANETISTADLIGHRQLVISGLGQNDLHQLPPMSANLWYCDSFNALYCLMLQGLGWSYLPSHLVKAAVTLGQVKVLMTTFDHKAWHVPVDLVMAKNQCVGPALAWLRDKMKPLF